MNQRINRVAYSLLTPSEKKSFSLEGLLKRNMYEYWKSGDSWGQPSTDNFVGGIVYRLRLVPKEIYYFEWDSFETYGEHEVSCSVAMLQENMMFCCSWGGCPATSNGIVVLRPATEVERKEFLDNMMEVEPVTEEDRKKNIEDKEDIQVDLLGRMEELIEDIEGRKTLKEVYLFKEVDPTPLISFINEKSKLGELGTGMAQFIIDNYEAIQGHVTTEIPPDSMMPQALLNEGRELEIYGNRNSYYGVWIDKTLTVYVDMETNQISGVNIPLTEAMKNKIKDATKIKDFKDVQDDK